MVGIYLQEAGVVVVGPGWHLLVGRGPEGLVCGGGAQLADGELVTRISADALQQPAAEETDGGRGTGTVRERASRGRGS